MLKWNEWWQLKTEDNRDDEQYSTADIESRTDGVREASEKKL